MNDLTTVTCSEDLIEFVGNMVECYRDCVINSEIEKTKREQIRSQAKVMIAQLEANTEQYISKINMDSETNIKLIQMVGEIIKKPEIDENCLKLCELLLSNLR